MQKKLQLYQNTFLNKQTHKLSLQIKLSLINSNYYDSTFTKSHTYNHSPTTKHSAHIKSFQSTSRQEIINQTNQQIDQKVQKLQHQFDKQFTMIHKFKILLKQRLEEYQSIQFSRQKYMKELLIKRKLQIQTLKRQVKLAIKLTVDQRQYFFHKIQTDFQKSIQQFFKNWKKIKKQWKNQLKIILTKFQGENNSKKHHLNINSSSQQPVKQQPISLKQLQIELKSHVEESKKKSAQLQIQLNKLLQNFHMKINQVKQSFSIRFMQVLSSVHKLQKNIKSQIKKQHKESEENRQKLLLLFEQNVDRIQQNKAQKQLQKANRYKPHKLEYRHIK